MQPPRPDSLSEALADPEALAGRALHGPDRSIELAELASSTGLEDDREALAGRNVLLATTDQFATAAALVELDGLVDRIVLCPPDLPFDYLPAILEHASIDAVVTDRPAADFPERSGTQLVEYTTDRRPTSGRTPSRPTEWVFLTSGTTGVPKMVWHSFAALTGAIGPTAPDAPAAIWSTFYDIRRYGGMQIYLRGMLGRGSLVLSSAHEPVADLLGRLGRHGVTHLSGTPSHWRRAVMSPALSAISPRYVRLSGEIADGAVLDALRAAFPEAGLGHAFASTEAGVAFEVTDGCEGFPASFLGRNEETGVELDLRDGALRIRSRRTGTDYVGSPGLSLKDDDGFVDTGDMVERRGERCFFVGRRGGIVNVGGLKVHPEEVEAIINAHPRVTMSLVEARPSPITGALVSASVVLDENGRDRPGDAMRADILAHCRTALPPHKVPALLRFVTGLDVSPAGKLVRRHG